MNDDLNIEVEFEGALSVALNKIQQLTGESYATIIKVVVAIALSGRESR